MMDEPKSRIREWAEELADISALEHGRDVPVDSDARVILTHEEMCRGERAYQVSKSLPQRVELLISRVTGSDGYRCPVELYDQEAG